MCGIAGFIDFNQRSSASVLHRMTRSMKHRGPDGEGFFFHEDKNYQIGLGHQRLSIIDLSAGGTQPMHFLHYSMLLNGEIYNYAEIKKELELLGHAFLSHSDTEVVLHAYIEWGQACLQKLIGMFAIVLYNQQTHEVFIARDRAGVKPFYYYWHKGLFLFTSELKAFHEHEGFEKKLNTSAAACFLQYGYVPSPYSIFEHTHKLPPGSLMHINLQKQTLATERYWDVRDAYAKPKIKIDFEEAKEETEKILKKAFQYRMVADVPVGVFLSGGYDSTSVATLLQKQRSQKLKTFTIGMGDKQLNEAPFAKQIADYLGTDHTEYYCTEKDALNLIDSIPFYYDEPFGDSSCIPTMLVSAMARKEVTVALSADAGDEIFAGYNRYDYVSRYLNRIRTVPGGLRQASAWLMEKLPLYRLSNDPLIAYRYRKIQEIIRTPNTESLMHILTSEFYFNEVSALFIDPVQPIHSFNDMAHWKGATEDPIAQMMAIDYQTYLPDDILQKVDRATMHTSLEGREPFLDQHIIEWVAQLPTDFKYHQGIKKHLLKEIVHKYVPKTMMDRPKMGFGIPLNRWLQRELRGYVEEHLGDEYIRAQQIFQLAEIQKIRNGFLNGKIQFTTKVWYLLMFQLWYKRWMQHG
jgi:asparagine synthase (glutamine-hydrolysing)